MADLLAVANSKPIASEPANDDYVLIHGSSTRRIPAKGLGGEGAPPNKSTLDKITEAAGLPIWDGGEWPGGAASQLITASDAPKFGGYVRTTRPHQAISDLDLPVNTIVHPLTPNTKPCMASSTTSIRTCGRAMGNDTDFGYRWANTLGRVEFSIRAVHALGVKITKFGCSFTEVDNISAGNNTIPVVPDESWGWSHIDLALDTAQELGMLVLVALPAPTSSGWGLSSDNGGTGYDYSKLTANWFFPILDFIADRYAGYSNVYIQPITEMQTPFGHRPSDWAAFTASAYDRVKSIAPNLKVCLSGCYHVSGLAEANGVIGLLDALSAANKLDKFDDFVSVNLYPSAALLRDTDRVTLDSSLSIGEGGLKDVAAIISKLDALAMSGTKVHIGEFGLFWAADGMEGGTATDVNDSIILEEKSKADLTLTYNYFKDNTRVLGIGYWVDWGREWNDAEKLQVGGNLYLRGLVGQPGMGLFVDNSLTYYKGPYYPTPVENTMSLYSSSGYPKPASTDWPTVNPENITGFMEGYGDVTRMVIRNADGTKATPAASTTARALGNIGFRGHDGAQFSSGNRASVQANPAQNYTPTAQGTRIKLTTTPNDTTTLTDRLVIDHDGTTWIADNAGAGFSIPANPSNSRLIVMGAVESRSGGYIFPNGSAQNTSFTGAITVSTDTYIDTDTPIVFASGTLTIFEPNNAGAGHPVEIRNTGAGIVTFNANWNGVRRVYPIGGSSTQNTLAIPAYHAAKFIFDGSNWHCVSLTNNSATVAGSDKQLQFNDAGAIGGAANLYWDKANNRLGIGTSSPTSTLHAVTGNAVPAKFERTATGVAGAAVTLLNTDTTANNGIGINLSSVTSTAAEFVAGQMLAQIPDHTNGNQTADVYFTARQNSTTLVECLRIKSTGTLSLNTVNQVHNGSKALTDNASTNICEIALAAGDMVGGWVDAVIYITDGTDYQTHSCSLQFAAHNKAGTIATPLTVHYHSSGSGPGSTLMTAGTYSEATAWTVTAGTGKITIAYQFDSSLTVTNAVMKYALRLMDDAVITLL